MRTTLISLHGRTPYTEDASGHYQILLLAFLAPGRFILFTAPADHVRNGSPQATKLPDIGLHGADSPTGYRGLRISAAPRPRLPPPGPCHPKPATFRT